MARIASARFGSTFFPCEFDSYESASCAAENRLFSEFGLLSTPCFELARDEESIDRSGPISINSKRG